MAACGVTIIFDFPGKMIVPIVSEPGTLPQWAMVELQGNLETYQSVIDPNVERFIGDLHYEKGNDNSAILIIGMHILHGKEVTLPKPLGVLVKNEKRDNDKDGNSERGTEWHVKALIRKKLVFKTRPRPIVTDMPKST